MEIVMLYTIALRVSITVPTVKMRKLCLREIFKKRMPKVGTPLATQWLRLCTPNAGVMGLIPGWKKIPYAMYPISHAHPHPQKTTANILLSLVLHSLFLS